MSIELAKLGDDNLQVFNTESRRGYYGKSKVRKIAQEGELNQIGGLKLKPQDAEEVADLAKQDKIDKFEQSIFEFEEEAGLEQTNQKPLNQLKNLSERFKQTTPSKMFYFKNREALRKYVDKTKEFNGEAIFFEDKLCIIQRILSMEDGVAQLKISELKLNQYLDLHEDYNNDMEALVEMVKPFNHVNILPLDAKSPGKKGESKEDLHKSFWQAFEKSEKSRKIEFIQNGRYIYIYTMSTQVRKGNNFETKGSTTFELQEIDLSNGKMSPISSHMIVSTDNDKTGYITASIGFSRRHGMKISPTTDKEIPRDQFLKSLMNEVVTVHEIQLRGGQQQEKVVLKTVGSFSELYCLYEGPLGCKLHFTSRVNSLDLLRLREEMILNKHSLEAYRRQAHDVGVIYLGEDSNGRPFFNIVEATQNAGKTLCEKYTAIDCSSTNVQSFKLRMTSNNFKYLYDESSDSFIFRRSQPVVAGTLVINDLIMNKIIFIEDTEEPKEYKLKVNNLQNHGMSFQNISCHKLGSFETYEANFRDNYFNLSSYLAYKFPLLDPKLRKQVVVSRTIKNMVRCEEKILHWIDGTKDATCFIDTDFKVKSLGLIHTDYICNSDIQSKVTKMKSTKSSYLSPVEQLNWKQKDDKTFLNMSKSQQLSQVFIRLFSHDNKMLLPRVTDVSNEDVKEPCLELFRFSKGGQIPTDEEYACIESDHAWQIFHERIRFENDDTIQRPLIFAQSVKDESGHFVRQHFWFTIFDFQSEQIVSQVHMNFPDLITQSEIKDISICACTEVTLRADRMYEQRFQVCFYLKNQLRAKIVEYTVSWDYNNGRQVTIKHTCSKEFILAQPDIIDTQVEAQGSGLKNLPGRLQMFQKPQNDEEHVHLIPFMDKSNQIIGTQFIYGDATCPSVFIFENAQEKTQPKGSKIPFIVDEGYKIYKDEKFGSYKGILVYAKMSEALLSDKILNHQEKAEIIEDSIKSILNSVVFDPTLSAPWQLKQKDYNKEFLQNIDIGRGVEIFDWFSITSLKMDNQDLESIMEDAKRHEEDDHKRYIDANLLSCSSLLERVMINDLVDERTENKSISENQQTLDYDRVRSLQSDQFYIKGHEILQRDIYLNHPLHYIFEMEVEDKEVNNDEYVGLILKFVFSEYNNCNNAYHLEAQEHLMSMIGDLMERNYMKVYYDNFLCQKSMPDPTSNKIKNGTLNICKPIEYRGMPRTQGSDLQAFHYKHEVHEFRQNENYTAQEFLKKQTLENGIETKVECLMLDLRFYLFEQKVKYIKSHTDHNGEISDSCYNPSIMPDFGYTSFDLSNLLLEIVEKTDGDIVNQKLIKHVIDWQYESTKTVTKWMLIGYAVGFFIPFFIQMYCFIGPVVIVCNSMCLFTSLLLMRFEIEQLRLQGCDYFKSGMNWVDIMGFLCYSTYFGLRISDPEMVMPDYKQNQVEDMLTLLSFPLIQYTSLKLLFFFKMFEEFGKFQHMVGAALGGIKIFLPFMLFWIFICSCQLYSIGSSYPQDDYPDLHEFIGIVITTWRNSLDNVSPPDYSKWSANLKEEQKDGLGWYSMCMIYLSWFIWFFNLLFILLVLTNFLISIVGNAYGGALEEEKSIVYALKSDLNQEVSLFNKWQSRDFELDSIFIVSKKQDIGEFEDNILDISATVQNQLNQIQQMKCSISSRVNENGHKMDKLSSQLSKK